jgi:hypothetical protein
VFPLATPPELALPEDPVDGTPLAADPVVVVTLPDPIEIPLP